MDRGSNSNSNWANKSIVQQLQQPVCALKTLVSITGWTEQTLHWFSGELWRKYQARETIYKRLFLLFWHICSQDLSLLDPIQKSQLKGPEKIKLTEIAGKLSLFRRDNNNLGSMFVFTESDSWTMDFVFHRISSFRFISGDDVYVCVVSAPDSKSWTLQTLNLSKLFLIAQGFWFFWKLDSFVLGSAFEDRCCGIC